MKKYVSVLLFLIFLSISFTAAQETSEKGLYHYVLDNGLELFVMENHATLLPILK